jgi:hypothetical protein
VRGGLSLLTQSMASKEGSEAYLSKMEVTKLGFEGGMDRAKVERAWV